MRIKIYIRVLVAALLALQPAVSVPLDPGPTQTLTVEAAPGGAASITVTAALGLDIEVAIDGVELGEAEKSLEIIDTERGVQTHIYEAVGPPGIPRRLRLAIDGRVQEALFSVEPSAQVHLVPAPAITEATPREFAAGEERELSISGTGFTAESKFFLVHASGAMQPLSVKRATEGGAEALLPSSLEPGRYRLLARNSLGELALESEYDGLAARRPAALEFAKKIVELNGQVMGAEAAVLAGDVLTVEVEFKNIGELEANGRIRDPLPEWAELADEAIELKSGGRTFRLAPEEARDGPALLIDLDGLLAGLEPATSASIRYKIIVKRHDLQGKLKPNSN